MATVAPAVADREVAGLVATVVRLRLDVVHIPRDALCFALGSAGDDDTTAVAGER